MGREEDMTNAIRDSRGKLTSCFDHVEKIALKIFSQKMDLLVPLQVDTLYNKMQKTVKKVILLHE